MDRERLTERLKELEVQLQQAQIRLQQANADVIAISGAMQEVKYWMNKIKESEDK